MTDQQIAEFLSESGYPEHVQRAGLAGLVKGWREFVSAVERGYQFGLYDYRNDLDARGILAMIEQRGVRLPDEVREADERLARQLTHREVRVWESAPGDPFWDFGYPSVVTDEFEEDLSAEGLA